MSKKDIGIDFSKKKINNQNIMSKIVKYCQTQKILANEIKHFVFQNNDLSDLCSLDMFSNLQKLDLSFNNYKVIPQSITSLTTLKHLNLSNNKIEMGENYIVPLTNLTYLDLSFNVFEDFNFYCFTTLTNLKTFKLTNNKLKRFNYDYIKPFKSIQEFSINCNYIEAPLFRDVIACLSITSPYFQYTPSKITNNIYLGSQDSTKMPDILFERNIYGVLSLGAKCLCNHKKIKNEYVDVADLPDTPLDKQFEKCFAFIDSILESGQSILIHCHAGISRSATVLIAYLMQKNKWRFRETMDFLRKKRPIVTPNSGFEKQLLMFEAKLFNLKMIDNVDKEE